MNTQEHIEKMLKKADKILQAGNENKPEQLKPCPYCGSGDVGLTTEFEEWEHYDETDWQEWHYVKCNGCDIELGRFYGEEEAVEAWNRRV